MDELKHRGVTGMKWGIFRSRSAKYKHGELGGNKKTKKLRARLKPKSNSTNPVKMKNKITNTRIKDMSTNELQEKVNRIRLEKEYTRLTTKEASTGSQFIKSVLYKSGSSVATSGLIKIGNYYTDQALGKYVYKKKD